MSPRVVAAIVGAALALAVVFRVVLVIESGFPVGDGGLFAAMVDGVRSTAPALPKSVSFNEHDLPFAYPPAAFFLAALVGGLTRADTTTVLWFLPLALNLLVLGAVCLLARRLLPDPVEFVGAVLVFLALPRSYEWLIMGGGLTRSAGMLFTVLAVLAADRQARAPGSAGARALPIAICVAGAVLSHPEWAVTAVVSVLLRLATAMEPRKAIRLAARAGAGAGRLVAPWAATVLARHGVGPFLAASATSEHSSTIVPMLLNFWFVQLQFVTYAPGLFVVLGMVVLSARKDLFLPLWLPLIFVTTPRHAPNPAAIPYALLASVGGAYAVRWAVERWSAPRALALAPAAVFAVSMAAGQLATPLPTMRAVTPDQRACMSFIRGSTPQDARFFVLSDALYWSVDWVAEWFPYLARRESLTTVQGLEWISHGAFAREGDVIDRMNALKKLQLSGIAGPTLGANIRGAGTGRDWALVAMKGATPAWGGFASSGRWRVAWAARDVVLFQEVPLR